MDIYNIIKSYYADPEEEMRDLIIWLNETTRLYDLGIPAVSDYSWDKKYYRLIELEKETGTVLPSSPTQSIYFEIRDYLPKIKHEHLMLSLDKTKDPKAVESFLGDREWIAMGKMDGLTCSLTYENGELVRAETRGDGEVGEDILHNAKANITIPNHIPYKKRLVVDGEIICTYKEFEKVKDQYKNPRNYAAGSIRLLNSHESRERFLTFVAWDVLEIEREKNPNSHKLNYLLDCLHCWRFTTVPYVYYIDNNGLVTDAIDEIKKECNRLQYPIDGVVFKFNDLDLRESLGSTAHHFNNAIAFKFFDELYDTRLRHIQWTMGRTGVLTPVAVFDPIDADGSIIERASLHNVSVMREVLGGCAYVGEPLQVYKANQIIPQIESAGPKYDYGYVIAHGGVSANDCPERCPVCGGDVTIKDNDGVEVLVCLNPNCAGKLINKLDHYLGKKGLDAKGISEATLEKLIDWGWVSELIDIYSLKNYEKQWMAKSGFGEKSVNKILNSIEEASKNLPWEKFLCALGVPLIGTNVCKDLSKVFNSWDEFRSAVDNGYKFYDLPNFGLEKHKSITDFDYETADYLVQHGCVEFAVPASTIAETPIAQPLAGKTFVITGSLKTYKNRAELQAKIEQLGGKVAGSVSKNTSYLINNDTLSTSSKNLTAKKLSIPIISEDSFNEMIS